MFSFSQLIQSIIWSLIDHFSRLLSGNFSNWKLILEIYFHLKIYDIQPTYEQILRLACSFTDIHMNIIENNEDDLVEHLLLWRDALVNFIHFNNHDFQLFFLITSIDFLIPKLSVKMPGRKQLFTYSFDLFSLLIKLMIRM